MVAPWFGTMRSWVQIPLLRQIDYSHFCGIINVDKLTLKSMRLLNKTIYLVAKQLRQWGYNFNENADERIFTMKREIQHIGGRIEFKIEQYPDGS